MKAETSDLIKQYVNDHIDSYHTTRVKKMRTIKLNDVLRRKNPYLVRAKNIKLASTLIDEILSARLSASEEGSFGGFLEDLAIFVSEVTGGGQKSAATGLDIELTRDNVRYLVAVKSGKSWGNASQHAALKRNFKDAVKVLSQSKRTGSIQPTLGICYGNFKTVNNGEYLHIGGQSFWHLISGDQNLYIDLIEPLGFEAEKHDKAFREERDNTYNRLVREFTVSYCNDAGAIDWEKLVNFVSQNMTP